MRHLEVVLQALGEWCILLGNPNSLILVSKTAAKQALFES